MKNPTLLIIALFFLAIVLIPVTTTIKMILIVLFFIVFLYLKRGYFYVVFASAALKGKNPDQQKAWRLYEKGAFCPLPAQYAIMIGNLFVQKGDAAVALRIYDFIIEKELKKNKPLQTVIDSANTSRSMALWVLQRKEEAVHLLQSLWDEGKLDKNLAVNLGTFLLDVGELERAKQLIEESEKELAETPGMIDNRGYWLYLSGSYANAYALYHRLLIDEGPQFPEAYYHGALVAIALEKFAMATKYLEQGLGKTFYQTSTVTVEQMEQLLKEIDGKIDSDGDVIDHELVSSLYDEDLFEDELPNTDLDEDDLGEHSIELSEEDYWEQEDQPIAQMSIESVLFDEEYLDDEDH